MKFNLVILDLDVLIYKCGFSIEKYDKDADVVNIEPIHHAYHNLKSMINKCLELSKCKNYKGFLTESGKSNFRFDVYKYYKENRVKCEQNCGDSHPYDCHGRLGHKLISKKPIYYNELREYLCSKYKAEIVGAQEADDSCSIEQCKNNFLGFDPGIKNSIIWSIDKDFKNTPGYHGNYDTGNIVYISELEALKNFYLQILTGDSSDGIPRIEKGWRQKNAESLIQKAKTEKKMFDVVFDEMSILFASEKLSFSSIEETITKRGQLVWLRRKENEMWEIPKGFLRSKIELSNHSSPNP